MPSSDESILSHLAFRLEDLKGNKLFIWKVCMQTRHGQVVSAGKHWSFVKSGLSFVKILCKFWLAGMLKYHVFQAFTPRQMCFGYISVSWFYVRLLSRSVSEQPVLCYHADYQEAQARDEPEPPLNRDLTSHTLFRCLSKSKVPWPGWRCTKLVKFWLTTYID